MVDARLVDLLNRAYYAWHEGLGFVPDERGVIRALKEAADRIVELNAEVQTMRRAEAGV